MSRYLLLVIINLPLILAGIISAVANYKTSRISKKRGVTEVVFWILVGIGLTLIEPVYNTLIQHNLTNSTPMSLFDMILLTLLLFCLLLITRTNEKVDELNKKLTRVHEVLTISGAHNKHTK